MQRILLLSAAALLQSSCSIAPVADTRAPAVERPGDPALGGKAYLLSEGDFRAIIAVARDYVWRKGPRYHLHRLEVASRSEVTVYVTDPDEFNREELIVLQRRGGEWRIIREEGLAVIVT